MSKQAEPGGEESCRYDGAVCVELEYVAVAGRSVLRDVLGEELGEQGIKLDEGVFARALNVSPPETIVGRVLTILGQADKASDALVGRVLELYSKRLRSDAVRPSVDMLRLLKGLSDANFAVKLVTYLPEEAARQLFDHLGLAGTGASIAPYAGDRMTCPRPDMWIKLAGELNLSPRLCVAVASSQQACKTALAANMGCVAAPDAYTDYQDFGGAALIVEQPGDLLPEAVKGLIAKPAFMV